MSFLMMLPDDLLLNCLARVSRWSYPTLSLVSKRLRSLLASPELYKTRTLLGCTESCLYSNLPHDDFNQTWFAALRRQIPDPDLNRSWFSQYFAPYRFLEKLSKNFFVSKKLRENFFVSVSTQSHTSFLYGGFYGLVTVGYNMYKIGGVNLSKGKPSSEVFFMDCRSHTWHEAPSMRTARSAPSVSVLDGKIYVAGGNKYCDSSNWMEFFDPKTQVWEHVQGPDGDIHKSMVFKIVALDEKLYIIENRSQRFVYEPKKNRWEKVGVIKMHVNRDIFNSCLVDNIIYHYGSKNRMLEWYDSEERTWRDLKGLESLLPRLLEEAERVRLVEYGKKIALLWEIKSAPNEKKIWCAEISLERHNREEIYGKIEWCNVVLTVPRSCYSIKALAVTF